ncbi:MAG: DUF481 domain-containing protein, partial [Alphaproteobacteria bacterium]|nr:DUF481 domain-containing protein [Alphaproteobacteria bacterium]
NDKEIQQFVTGLKQQFVTSPKQQKSKQQKPKLQESEPTPPPQGNLSDPQRWNGEMDLNYLRSSGNTRQESLGFAGKLQLASGRYHHTIRSFLDLNKNTGVTDKKRWGLSYKLDYDFSEELYATSFTGYENNQFGAFRERITTSLGFGYPVINTDHYNWRLEVGPGLLFTKELPGGKYVRNLSVFASSIFNWTINDRSDFTNITKFYIGSKNIIESQTALKVKINGSLSSKFSYNIMYNRDSPLTRRKTDSVARAGLSYDF